MTRQYSDLGWPIWPKDVLDKNGGHAPECDGYCHPSCPIGQEERRKANERARRAQEAWSRS